jgi:fucose permease
MSWVTPPVLVGLGVSATATAASTFSTLGLGALAPTLRSSLHLSTAEVGLIPGLVSLGALTASVPAGRVTDRIGAGRSLTLALLGVAAGVIIAVLAPGRWVFLGGAFVAGLGYGAVNPATNVRLDARGPRRAVRLDEPLAAQDRADGAVRVRDVGCAVQPGRLPDRVPGG